jgi:SAM-dependent methyltransferase
MRPSFNDIALDFDRMFENLERLTDLEGEALDAVLKPRNVKTVLDCACGTGIQSIGLARLGYEVAASDISALMVQRLAEKAAQANLAIEVHEADFRNLKPWRGRTFDAVVCSGNSLTLMKRDADISKSLACMVESLVPGRGVLVIGMHNYLVLREGGENMLLRKSKEQREIDEVIIDLRSFENDRAEVTYLFVSKKSGHWKLKTYTKSYRMLTPEELGDLMMLAGCNTVQLLDVSGQRPYHNDEWVLAVGTV